MIEFSKLEESDKGRSVKYIPRHANFNLNHPSCEDGIISSWEGSTIYVRYSKGQTAAATSYRDLIFNDC